MSIYESVPNLSEPNPAIHRCGDDSPNNGRNNAADDVESSFNALVISDPSSSNASTGEGYCALLRGSAHLALRTFRRTQKLPRKGAGSSVGSPLV